MVQAAEAAQTFQWEAASTVIVPQINAEGLHVWPFDQSFPVDVRHFSLDSPCRMRMNRHSFFELAYVEEGAVELQVQDRVFQVRTGDLMVIGSSLYHRMTNLSEEPLRLRVLYFQGDVLQGTAEGEEYLAPFLLRSSSFPHVLEAGSQVTEEIGALLKRLCVQLPASSNRDRLVARTLLRMVLMLLVDHYAECCTTQESLRRRERDLERLNPVFQMVEDRYHDQLRVSDAARVCAMSVSHFMSFFKTVTGQPFLRYLNHFRIAKAQWLLTAGRESIVSIAQQLGFCDQSHFGVVFREVVGLTPHAYRRDNARAELVRRSRETQELFGDEQQTAPMPSSRKGVKQGAVPSCHTHF